MLEEYKTKIGYYIFKKKIKKDFDSNFSFTDFIENTLDYILILPLNDLDYSNSFDVAKYFKIHKKNVTLFIPEHKKNSVSISNNYHVLDYSINEISKLGLPNKTLMNKINQHNFDVLIDLEREENLFLAAVTSLINAKYKVGFKKEGVDNLYNFQLVNSKINSEISYRNLLNSLKMF